MGDRIERVELFEDRAAIVRVVDVEEGRQEVRFGPMTPLVAHERLTVPRQVGDAPVLVDDVRIERVRNRVEAADSEPLARLRQTADAAEQELVEARMRVERAEDRVGRVQRALEAAMASNARTLQEGESPEGWVAALQKLGSALREAELERAAAKSALPLADGDAKRASSALALAERGREVDEVFVVVRLHADSAGPFRIRTVVPCALWRPLHRAVLRTGDGQPTVEWEVRAACWNATGEDWENVELVCSTARPGERADAPVLTDDRVTVERRSSTVVVEAREEEVEAVRETGGIGLPGVDDGGEPRVYVLAEPVDLPASGTPVFVGLDRWSAPTDAHWVSAPLLAGNAILKTVVRNTSGRPLLAGPVELVQDDRSVGRSSIGFVAVGEEVPLGWGSHDGVRVVRTEKHEVENALVTGSQTHTFAVTLHVNHLGRERLQLRVLERLPISEVRGVDVELVAVAPAFDQRPDADGRCAWELDLPGRSSRTLSLEYRVTAGRNVALPFG